MSAIGEVVGTSGDIWRFHANPELSLTIVINWDRLKRKGDGTTRRLLEPEAAYLFRLYLAERARTIKPRSLIALFNTFLRFLTVLAERPGATWTDGLAISDLTAATLEEYLVEMLPTQPQSGRIVADVRVFYRWGVEELQHAAFSRDALLRMSSVRCRKPPNHEALRARDPRRGPFDDDELYAIRRALAAEIGSDRDRTILAILLHTGLRPTEMATLRNSDFQRFQSEVGIWHQLRVRTGKQHHNEDEYRYFKLAPVLAALIERVRNAVLEPDAMLLHWLAKNHNGAIRSALNRFFDEADLRSERLPEARRVVARGAPRFERMPSNPYRFRYTIATHLIEQGAAPAYVAKHVLGHADLQSIQIYAEMRSSIADGFKKATDSKVEPLVRRMLGQVDDPAAPSACPPVMGDLAHVGQSSGLPVLGPIGKCGADGHCRRNPVTGCYNCESFIALPDGPHRELRDLIQTHLSVELATRASPRILRMMDETLKSMDEWITHLSDIQGASADLVSAAAFP